MKKKQEVMVEVVYLFGAYIMLETLQGDLGCNRRVGGLCSCVSYQLMHLEVSYVKLNLAIIISPHFVGM